MANRVVTTGYPGVIIGPPGQGIPPGGDLGQILAKASNRPFDAEWVDPLPDISIVKAGNRIDLASVAPERLIAFLSEFGREGMFRWDPTNLTTRVAIDTQQGIYVPPLTNPAGAFGAWVRMYTGPMMSSWFGAVPDGATDSILQLQGMLNVLRSIGGTGRFNSTTVGSVYRIGGTGLVMVGPLPKRIGLECDQDVWLEKHLSAKYNLLNITSCEDMTLGNMHFSGRFSSMAGVNANGLALSILNSSNITHTGRIRLRDFSEGINIFTNTADNPPICHDVNLDYVEIKNPVTTDAAGHVISGGLSVSGITFEDMKSSGVRFVFAEGILKAPGYSAAFMNNCVDCWVGAYVIRQCLVGPSAPLGSPKNCFFGPGLADQVKQAVIIVGTGSVNVGHMRARFHPDGITRVAGTPGPWFINVNATGANVIAEIVDYNDATTPPIRAAGVGNNVIVPWINGSVPIYATVLGEHNNVVIQHDASVNAAQDILTKFTLEEPNDISHSFEIHSPGHQWVTNAKTAMKFAGNRLFLQNSQGGVNFGQPIDPTGVLDYTIDLLASAYHGAIDYREPTAAGTVQPTAHVRQVILKPTGTLVSKAIKLPDNPANGLFITFLCTENITTVNWAIGAGASAIVGAPTTLAANAPVSFRYRGEDTTWYRG